MEIVSEIENGEKDVWEYAGRNQLTEVEYIF